MEFLTSFTFAIFSFAEMSFWYLIFFLMLCLVGLIYDSTYHKRYNPLITSLIFALLLLMVMYPPWCEDFVGACYSEGYDLITTYRYNNEYMIINTKRLLIQGLVVLIFGVAIQEALMKYKIKIDSILK